MAKTDGPVSATYLNPIREDLLRYAQELREFLLKNLYASGYPVNTEPMGEYDAYSTLVTLKMAGSPDYWQNPDAQEELRKLEQKYGPSPEPTPQTGMVM